MIIAPSAQKQIDTYLNDLSARLQAAPAEDRREFIDEIRSHIFDAAGSDGRLETATVSTVLAELGPASALADNYLKSIGMPAAFPVSRPAESGPGFAGRAQRVRRTVYAFLGLLVAFALAAVSIVAVVSKIFHPERAGLWRFGSDEFSLHLGLTDFVPPPVGQELLGWYLVPLGLLIGIVALLAAKQIARRWLRGLRLNQGTGTSLLST